VDGGLVVAAVTGYEHLPIALQAPDESHQGHDVIPHVHVLMDDKKFAGVKPCSGRFYCQQKGCRRWFTGPLCKKT
jgi:hypothetical protein